MVRPLRVVAHKPGIVVLRLLSLTLAALVAVPLMVVAPDTSDAQSLEDARTERAQVQRRLDDAASELALLERRAAEAEAEHAALTERLQRLEATSDELDERLSSRARELYKRGAGSDPISVVLSSGDADVAVSRATTMQQLIADDTVDAEDAAAVRTELGAVAKRLEQRERAAEVAERRQQEVTSSLEKDLDRAQELERRLEAEARERARKRREAARRAAERRAEQAAAERREERATAEPASVSAPAAGASTSSGGKACPVDQPRSFTDTWGAPRSGGRSHQGTDILAPRGTPVRAITSGTWDIYPYGASAGNWAMLHGNDGNQYWYMHLERHTVGDGASVSAGQQVATNGDTGNASGTPHVHFELHPGGGSAVNPYPLLVSVC